MITKSKNFSSAFEQLFELQQELDKPTNVLEGADAANRERYLIGQRSPAPYQWQSNHIRETLRLTGPVYIAIKVLAEQAAMAELKCFKWGKDARMGGDQDCKEPLHRDHRLCKLMRRPNKRATDGYLRRQMVQQLALTGTSLSWRVDDGFDRPVELWSVPTASYQPVPICELYPDGAYRVMPYFPGPLAMVPGMLGSGGVVVDARNMLAVRHPHPLLTNGDGYSPLSACSYPLDTVESIDQARFSTARRGAFPSLIVEQDLEMKNPDSNDLLRVQQQLYQLLGTPERAGKIAVLSPGMKANQQDVGGREIGWVESWSQLVGFVMSVFGVSKSIAFMNEEASYAALYASLKQFNLFSMCPLLKLIEDAFNLFLVEPFFGDDYFVELVPRKIDDEQILESQLANDLKTGIRTCGELRVLRGLQLLGEPWEKDRAFATTHRETETEKGSGEFADEKPQDGDVEKTRPKNDQGKDSLGPQPDKQNQKTFYRNGILNGFSRNGISH